MHLNMNPKLIGTLKVYIYVEYVFLYWKLTYKAFNIAIVQQNVLLSPHLILLTLL